MSSVITNNDNQSLFEENSKNQLENSFADITTTYYLDEADLRPGGQFIKGYKEIRPYQDTAFGEVTLKKTRNGQRAKSGIHLENPISPVTRTKHGLVSRSSGLSSSFPGALDL